MWKFLRALSISGDLSHSTYGSSIPKKLNAAAADAGVNVKKVRAGVVAARNQKIKAKKKRDKK
jgi:hypothetical protein